MKTNLGKVVFHKTQVGFNKKGSNLVELQTQNNFYPNPSYSEDNTSMNPKVIYQPINNKSSNGNYITKVINRKSFCQNLQLNEEKFLPAKATNVTFDFTENSNPIQANSSINSRYKSTRSKISQHSHIESVCNSEIEDLEKRKIILSDHIKQYRMKRKLENITEKPQEDTKSSRESNRNSLNQKNTIEIPKACDCDAQQFRPMTSIINTLDEKAKMNQNNELQMPEFEKNRPTTHHSENIEKILIKERPNSRYNKKTLCCPIPKTKENSEYDVKICKMDINTFSANSEIWPSCWKVNSD